MTDNQSMYTTRLRIEPLQRSHAEMVFPAQQDPQIFQYIPQNALSLTELTKRYAFLEKGTGPKGKEHWLNWVVFLKETDVVIGTFQATVQPLNEASIAYTVFPTFWGQGFATEMGIHLLSYIFNTHTPQTIIAEIDTRNMPSIKLVELWGFTQIKTTKNADFFKGSTSDEFTYAIQLNEWQHCHSQKLHQNE